MASSVPAPASSAEEGIEMSAVVGALIQTRIRDKRIASFVSSFHSLPHARDVHHSLNTDRRKLFNDSELLEYHYYFKHNEKSFMPYDKFNDRHAYVGFLPCHRQRQAPFKMVLSSAHASQWGSHVVPRRMPCFAAVKEVLDGGLDVFMDT